MSKNDRLRATDRLFITDFEIEFSYRTRQNKNVGNADPVKRQKRKNIIKFVKLTKIDEYRCCRRIILRVVLTYSRIYYTRPILRLYVSTTIK